MFRLPIRGMATGVDVVYMPSVARLLHEHNVTDVSAIKATGPNGRLLKGDVLAWLDHGKQLAQKTGASPKVQERVFVAGPNEANDAQVSGQQKFVSHKVDIANLLRQHAHAKSLVGARKSILAEIHAAVQGVVASDGEAVKIEGLDAVMPIETRKLDAREYGLLIDYFDGRGVNAPQLLYHGRPRAEALHTRDAAFDSLLP